MIKEITNDLNSFADAKKAKLLSRYFKTGKGQYGEGDIFIGIVVPKIRKIAHKYIDANFDVIQKLLESEVHEFRLTALEILVAQYERANNKKTKDKKKEDEKIKKAIYKFYLKNTRYINNWDLVDLSASYIVGDYLLNNDNDKYRDRDRAVLYRLARSKNIWERRISIISTHAFIKAGEYKDVFKLAEMLLSDKHDLIHKAVGWMLRDVGKRISRDIEKKFLNKYYKKMPRVMLSYATEHFSKEEKDNYK